MLKATLKVRIDSLVICFALVLFLFSLFPFHLLWDAIPREFNIVSYIMLYITHVILLVLGVLFIQKKSFTLGSYLLSSALVFAVGGGLSWLGLTYFYPGAVGSGLRVYFVILPVIFSIFNGFHGSLIQNMIRYVGLFCMYTMLLVLA